MDPLPLAVRDPVRFRLESIRTHLLKRLVRTYDRGLSGLIGKDEAPGYAVGVKAATALLDRIEPTPKAVVQAAVQGTLIVQWATPESSSPTDRALSRPSSIAPLLSNGHGPVSSSVTDDLGSL